MIPMLREKVGKIAFEAMDRSDTLKDIVVDIQNSLERDFGGQWQTIAYSFGDESIHKKKNNFIRFEIAELKILLFQLEQTDSF